MALPTFVSSRLQEPVVASATAAVPSIAIATDGNGIQQRAEAAAMIRDLYGDSVENGGASAAPAAGATLATLTPGAGTWEIQATLSVIGDITDNGNSELKKNNTVLAVLASGLSPAFRKTLAANDTVSVVVIANGSAGSEYAATLVARQIA